jgi:adenosylmethionine-8-amino-7-oxononanoate aminotransferase
VLQLVGERPLNWLRRRFVDKGVWIRPFGNIIYLTPALTITEAEIHYLVDSMMEVIEELAES